MGNCPKYEIIHFPIFIYMLYDNKENKAMYVGATRNLKNRLINHRSKKFKDYANINYLSIEVLEETTSEFTNKLEVYWYWQVKSWGFDLMQKHNSTSGGILPSYRSFVRKAKR